MSEFGRKGGVCGGWRERGGFMPTEQVFDSALFSTFI